MPAVLLQPILKRSLLLLLTLSVALLALMYLERAMATSGPTLLPSISKVATTFPNQGGGNGNGNNGNGGGNNGGKPSKG